MPREKTPTYPSDEEVAKTHEDEALALQLAQRSRGTDLEPLQESPALNRLLLKNARKSPSDIAKITGLPEAEVAERLSSLLDNRSWRDDLMEEKLLLAEIAMLMDDIRDRMARFGTEDEGWASMARVQLQAIKTILEQMEKRRKAVNGELSLVSKLQAEMFAEAIRFNNQLTAESLARKYDIEEEIVYAEWEENFPRAIQSLEARTNKND